MRKKCEREKEARQTDRHHTKAPYKDRGYRNPTKNQKKENLYPSTVCCKRR
jgi:hypothetical protein